MKIVKNAKNAELTRRTAKPTTEELLCGTLRKSLAAIQGYQKFEELKAEEDGNDVKNFRVALRKELNSNFDSTFHQPGHVQQMLNDLNEE